MSGKTRQSGLIVLMWSL